MILKHLDELGSIETELAELIRSSSQAAKDRVEANERKAKRLEERAEGLLGEIESTPKPKDLLDRRSAVAVRGEGGVMVKRIQELRRKHSELLEATRKRFKETVVIKERPHFDLRSAFDPILNYYSQVLGAGAVGDGGKIVFKASGHTMEFHEAGVDVACEDVTGLRKLLHGMAEKAPSFLADVANELGIDRGQLAQESQDIIKHAEESTFSRVKQLRKELKDKKKAEKGEGKEEKKP